METPLSSLVVGMALSELFLRSLRLVLFLALLVSTGSDLSVFYIVVDTFIIIARAPRGAVRCTASRLKVFSSIENIQ